MENAVYTAIHRVRYSLLCTLALGDPANAILKDLEIVTSMEGFGLHLNHKNLK